MTQALPKTKLVTFEEFLKLPTDKSASSIAHILHLANRIRALVAYGGKPSCSAGLATQTKPA